ncbi:hypothetical protein K458DRAFT_125328 [Lentithecium fluviatile CBS 122367]|uniref:Sister chromatid cohesion protein Ctf8 n=1 Tax=Lentithecium fluviatile CBS 122367 TaxID=1168545 RepID=A0A6G1JFH1_9PLEO|nr:hypothetical protein K458DRAFT_125328 [Lentithecium fluviatile CBS 122367]
MPSISLHPRPLQPPPTPASPLPHLLHTPSGLALLELQGDIRFPPTPASPTTHVGKLIFPLYNPVLNGEDDTKWMKRVWFYVGGNQRLAGEVKKLGKPFAVVRRRVVGQDKGREGDTVMGGADEAGKEELEIVEVVRYKIVFSNRPEPVGGTVEEGG